MILILSYLYSWPRPNIMILGLLSFAYFIFLISLVWSTAWKNKSRLITGKGKKFVFWSLSEPQDLERLWWYIPNVGRIDILTIPNLTDNKKEKKHFF